MSFFKELFSDDNHLNEKSIIGFISFCVMILFALSDIVTGYFGKELVVTEFIFNSFLIMTLGCFGISSVDKYINSKKEENNVNNNSQPYIEDEVID